MRWGILLSFVFVAACSWFPKRQAELKVDEQAAAEDQARVLEIEKLRETAQTEKAIETARRFVEARPYSVYREAARAQEARALEDLERHAEAEAIYRDVREKTLGDKPEIATFAEWRMSFTAEAQGFDSRAMLHVLGAEKRKADLPPHVASVELPARKSALAFRLGQNDVGEKAFREAERGLRDLIARPGPKPSDDWLAMLYLGMGKTRNASLNAENFRGSLKAQSASQPYLLKALRAKNPVVSPEALQTLRTNYADFWNTLARIPVTDSSDGAITARLKREKQIPLLAELVTVMEEAQAVRPSDSEMNVWEKEFFALIDDLAVRARRVLYSNSETTVLTEESRLLNGIRRGANPIPVPKKNSDPNL